MEDAVVIGKEELQSTHTRAPELRGEVLSGLERRRRWSTEEKLRVLAQSVAPGSSPSLTCRLHGISSGQLYTWHPPQCPLVPSQSPWLVLSRAAGMPLVTD